MDVSQTAEDPPIIEALALSKHFGGLCAVENYSLRLAASDLVGLIGPNGAGKTTAFNLLSGVVRPGSGQIRLNGRNVGGQKPYQLARAGVARTFQNSRLFAGLTVLENVMCGAALQQRTPIFSILLHSPAFRRREAAITERAQQIIAALDLNALQSQRAGALAYGQQRRVEIARALAMQPKALLLDEPAAGLNPSESGALMELIRHIHRQFGIGILLVEHDMRLVMNLCLRIQVMSRGRLLCEGSPQEVQNHPEVIEAYLGKGTVRA